LLVAYFDRIVHRYRRRTDIAAASRAVCRAPCWGAIEAHHHYRDIAPTREIATGVDLRRAAGRRNDAVERDVASYARLVDGWRSRPVETGDPIAFEAQVRWVHARLTQHRPDLGPGRFKLEASPASEGRRCRRAARPVPRRPSTS
jgi:hypothetical protein